MMSHDLLVQMAYLQSFTFSLSARGSEKRSATQSRSNLALLEKKRKTKYRTGLSYEHRKLVEPKHNCTYSLRSCPLPIIPLRLSRPKKQRSQKKKRLISGYCTHDTHYCCYSSMLRYGSIFGLDPPRS